MWVAPTETTTLRVPTDLRDEIARLARARGSTMLEVVTDAIHKLTREEWWGTVHDALDAMTAHEVDAYRAEADRLDGAAADGLGGR
jgi:predicted transcriptional regulator